MTASQLFSTDPALAPAAKPEAAEAPSAPDATQLAAPFFAALGQALKGGRDAERLAAPELKQVSTSLTTVTEMASVPAQPPLAGPIPGPVDLGQTQLIVPANSSRSLKPEKSFLDGDIESELASQKVLTPESIPDPDPLLQCQSCYFAPPIPPTPPMEPSPPMQRPLAVKPVLTVANPDPAAMTPGPTVESRSDLTVSKPRPIEAMSSHALTPALSLQPPVEPTPNRPKPRAESLRASDLVGPNQLEAAAAPGRSPVESPLVPWPPVPASMTEEARDTALNQDREILPSGLKIADASVETGDAQGPALATTPPHHERHSSTIPSASARSGSSRIPVEIIQRGSPETLPVSAETLPSPPTAVGVSTMARPEAEGRPDSKLAGWDLPGEDAPSEKVALVAASNLSIETLPRIQREGTKPLSGLGLLRRLAPAPPAIEPGGTTDAHSKAGMESPSNSDLSGAEIAGPIEADELSSDAGKLSSTQGETTLFNSRSLVATDWQTGRPVASSDRPAPDISVPGREEGAVMVERMTSLVMREAALIKQHTTDSMSLLVRPDANTELVLHLTQRNGQVEVFVRCERGDFDHLNALWPQLQDSLSDQKVRLAPLQESSLHDPSRQPGRSGGIDLSQNGQHPRRQSAPGEVFGAERPLSGPPAAPEQSSDDRGRSGTGLATHRPGWETWA